MASHSAIVVSQFGDASVLNYTEIDTPKPSASQVLVRLYAAGVNPVDTYIRSGSYARKPELPYTPGCDGAGVVEEVGESVTAFKKGDRVWKASLTNGTYTTMGLYDQGELQLLPESLSFAQGCALNIPYGTAYRALFQRTHVEEGESVLVHGGSGGVGLAAIQICKAKGIKVFATAGTEAGLQLLRDQGVDGAFNHRSEGYMQEIAAAAGDGVDVVLEMLANVNLDKDLDVLARGGRVAVIGSRGTVEIDPRKTMGKEAAIMGVAYGTKTEAQAAEIFAALQEMMGTGSLQPVLGKKFSLKDASAAHEYIMAPPSGANGKVWVDCAE